MAVVTLSTWPSARPPQHVLDEAERRLRDGDERKPNLLANYADATQRRQGFVAEAVFARWLDLQHARFTHDGGPNGRPDFIVEGADVALRCSAILQGPFKATHLVYVFDTHLAEGTPAQRFFVGYEKPADRYVLLGGISTRAFLGCSTSVAEGALVCRGFIAQFDMHVTQINNLDPPARWLNSLRARAN